MFVCLFLQPPRSPQASTVIPIATATSPTVRRKESRTIQGSILHKLEIIVNFFQVYCIILWISNNFNLQWPSYWGAIKTGYDWPPYLLTLDVQSTYALRGLLSHSQDQEVRNFTLYLQFTALYRCYL